MSKLYFFFGVMVCSLVLVAVLSFSLVSSMGDYRRLMHKADSLQNQVDSMRIELILYKGLTNGEV